MPEEKKSTNLKDRLKKTAVAPAPNPGVGGVAPPGGGGPSVAPPVSAPPGFGEMQSPFGPGGIPGGMGGGIPGMGDVPPPAFVQQQQAAAAAAARARAAADDPFGSAAPGPVPQQEMRIVIDGGAVADSEVGRSRTGSLVAIAVAGIVMGVAGFGGGLVWETRTEEHATLASLAGVRTGVTAAGDSVNQLKTNVDRAAEHANIPAGGQGDDPAQQAAPTHPPDVDEAFITWAQSQDPEHPPFTPDVYAGRVGRLRSEIVTKLAQLQVQVDAAWRQLSVISRTNVTNTRASLASVGGGANEWQRGVVTFARNPAGATFAQLVTAPAAPDAQGHITLAGANLAPPLTRMFYQTGPLTQDQLPTVAIPVMPNVGLAQQAQTAAGEQWLIYRGRLAELKALADAMATTQQQLSDALRGGGGH